MEAQRSILHQLGVVWRGRDNDPYREQLPERWVDLIKFLNEHERSAHQAAKAQLHRRGAGEDRREQS